MKKINLSLNQARSQKTYMNQNGKFAEGKDQLKEIEKRDENSGSNDDINNSKVELTNGTSNKKTVFGVALAILSILCIILSLIVAESVLLCLLIPGRVLFIAWMSILVGLFLNNKHDKSINLSSGYNTQGSISENEQNNEIKYPPPSSSTDIKQNLLNQTHE